MQRPLRLRILALLGLLIAAYAGANFYVWAKQRYLIFEPTTELARTPSHVKLRYEDVSVPMGGNNGATLHGWWIEGSGADPPVALYLHGNDLNLGGEIDRIASLHEIGFSVLAVDYRGYGKSRGAFPSESRVYEDAEAAWNYLVALRQIEPGRLFIYGHSLGAALAIELGLRRPEAAGIIVEGAFTSLSDMAKRRYWMFPVDWLLNQRFDSLVKVANLQVPILFIHGTADDEVPHEMSEHLFSASRGRKSLVLIPGAGHENNALIGRVLYERAVTQFVSANRRGKG